MKKIFIAMALLLGVQAAFAQQNGKTVAEAKAEVEAALANTENAKKASKPDTWIKLGNAYLDAHAAPQLNGIPGSSMETVNVVMAKEKVRGTSKVTLDGKEYTKKSYSTANYYFNDKGILQIVEVTKPAYKNVLDLAFKAFQKAYELDAAKKKTKVIIEACNKISKKYEDDAYTAYQVGKYDQASLYFEGVAKVTEAEPISKLDTSFIYNAAFTAYVAKNYDRAERLFKKSIAKEYYGNEGDVYSKLADIAKAKGDTTGYKNYLEQGFAKFPQSQFILVGLINYYLESGEKPDELFVLLDAAKKNEPTNASLYYVEGNIRSKLGQVDAALAAYRKCSEVNPEYEFGALGEGLYFYNQAVAISEQASKENDDAKYNQLVKDFEVAMKNCIAPFEKAFNITKDKELKSSLASYLKSACYRFVDDPEYKAKYDTYKAAAE